MADNFCRLRFVVDKRQTHNRKCWSIFGQCKHVILGILARIFFRCQNSTMPTNNRKKKHIMEFSTARRTHIINGDSLEFIEKTYRFGFDCESWTDIITTWINNLNVSRQATVQLDFLRKNWMRHSKLPTKSTWCIVFVNRFLYTKPTRQCDR